MSNPITRDAPKIIFDPSFARSTTAQCDCPQECACSLPDVFHHLTDFSAALEAEQTYQVVGSVRTIVLDSEHTLYYGPYHRPAVLNRSAAALLARFATPTTVQSVLGQANALDINNYQAPLQKLLHSGLLVQESWQPPDLNGTGEQISAWIHTTDACNLRCDYCYLPHHPKHMSVEVGQAAVDATVRSALAHGFSRVHLKYAGGEATLQMALIQQLHRYAMQKTKAHNLTLSGVLLTNGTLLTTECLQSIKALGLSVMISLDGLGQSHDQQRPFASGKGSSATVQKAIDRALAFGIVPDISVTVSRRNLLGIPGLVRWLVERDLPFSLNFYRSNDYSASFADLQFEEQEIIDGMKVVYKSLETQLPRRNLLASLVDYVNLSAPHLRTCSVGESYLVFDYLGQVAKCQMQMAQPITTTQAADPLALIRADRTSIQNLSVDEKEGCITCEWKYWCTGGCPLTTHRATGRYDIKSPNCNIYKALYPKAMRLEGLRLLKYRQELA